MCNSTSTPACETCVDLRAWLAFVTACERRSKEMLADWMRDDVDYHEKKKHHEKSPSEASATHVVNLLGQDIKIRQKVTSEIGLPQTGAPLVVGAALARPCSFVTCHVIESLGPWPSCRISALIEPQACEIFLRLEHNVLRYDSRLTSSPFF